MPSLTSVSGFNPSDVSQLPHLAQDDPQTLVRDESLQVLILLTAPASQRINRAGCPAGIETVDRS